MAAVYNLVFLLFVPSFSAGDASPNAIVVQKCCERSEILVNDKCRYANETGESPFTPSFKGEDLVNVEVSDYRLIIGVPGCGTRQPWPVYHGPYDRLFILTDGTLRHYTVHDPKNIQEDEDLAENKLFYDYKPGLYCVDKYFETDKKSVSQFAIVCNPETSKGWKDTDFILRKVIDPTFHITGIISYTSVAIIHFVLPQLRDLVGNIITTMSICLVVSQAADLVRIFTEFTSPISFLVADIIMFVSLLGAFNWLNSLGFYIWKTFRSRNVFLRITDGRKYCYYSYFVWASTASMSLLAVFAHFTLDTPSNNKPPPHHIQGTAIGWLGIAVFFSPMAFTVFANVYFYISTLKILSRMSTYGRIHHKLKFCFETFLKLFIVMAVSWIFLLVSWLPFPGVYYSYIFINALEAPLILYISVLSQRKVRFLLRKACCYDKCLFSCLRPDQASDTPEWGEEMMAMNR